MYLTTYKDTRFQIFSHYVSLVVTSLIDFFMQPIKHVLNIKTPTISETIHTNIQMEKQMDNLTEKKIIIIVYL